MLDLHSHILPGLDDGARTLEDSVEIARAAHADGIEVIAATPHVRDDYPTSADTMESRVAEVRRALADASAGVELRPGGEIAVDWLPRLSRDELGRFGLAGNPRYVLVEMPYYGWPLELPDEVFHLRTAGITPVLAHPERNATVQENPERLRPLVETGALVQLTAASLDGRLGRTSRETGLKLLKLGFAHLVASDAHTAGIRQIGLSAAVRALGDDVLARWLVRDVPAAIVSDERLPPRPHRAGRRWFRLRTPA